MGYRGELKIRFKKIGNKDKIYELGDKVAQLVLMPILKCNWAVVDSQLDLPQTMRGAGGYGSTGTK